MILVSYNVILLYILVKCVQSLGKIEID